MTGSMAQTEPPSVSPRPSGSPSADSEVVTWMGGFCAELGKLAQLAEVNPPEVETGAIAGAQEAVVAIIDKPGGAHGSLLAGQRAHPAAHRSAGASADPDLNELVEPRLAYATNIAGALVA